MLLSHKILSSIDAYESGDNWDEPYVSGYHNFLELISQDAWSNPEDYTKEMHEIIDAACEGGQESKKRMEALMTSIIEDNIERFCDFEELTKIWG